MWSVWGVGNRHDNNHIYFFTVVLQCSARGRGGSKIGGGVVADDAKFYYFGRFELKQAFKLEHNCPYLNN